MQRTIKTLLLLTGAAGVLSACTSNNNNSGSNTAIDTAAAPMTMDTSGDWHEDWEKFRDDARTQIQKNEDTIIAFRARAARSSAKFKARYEARIEDLKAKNDNLRVQLDDFKEDTKDKWNQFKVDFKKAMDTLTVRIDSRDTIH